MSSFTFADNKLGGRLQAAADAIAAGKLRTAAGIFNEVAEELNIEAESTDGLMAEEEPGVGFLAAEDSSFPRAREMAAEAALTKPVQGTAMDLQMCARNVHAYGAPDSNGWRTCSICGSVNVAPPDA